MSRHRRYQRPARWGLAVGLPGRAPSRQARQLAASPHAGDLPAGVWHVSADVAPLLASTTPVVHEATHAPTGARCRLLSLPDGPILSLCPLDDAARELIAAAWADPSAWANAQHWWLDQGGGG